MNRSSCIPQERTTGKDKTILTIGGILMDEKKLTVRAVERSLDILTCFTQKPQLGMMEISQMTGLNKSTVFRLLLTLEEKGFIQRDPSTEKYSLGLRIWELSTNLDQSSDPAHLFLPEMERLRDDVEETISLYIRDGHERIRVQAVESRQTIRRIAPIGARMPLSVGASSKVIMAHVAKEIQDAVYTSEAWPTNVDKCFFQTQLQKVKEEGYAMSVEEREAGTAAICVPVFDRRGFFVAALAISGPVSRMNRKRMQAFLPRLLEASERMGKRVKG